MGQDKLVKRFIIGTFVTLYITVSLISTIHVIDFFQLSNPRWLAVTLAIGFELGAAASLASLVILNRMNKTLVWSLFITITLMQMQGNMYHAFTNLQGFESWSELFSLIEDEQIYQKRILSFVSGAILPLVALGFIKSLVDYIKPVNEEVENLIADDGDFDELDDLSNYPIKNVDNIDTEIDIDNILEDEEFKDWEVTLNDGLENQEWEDYYLPEDIMDENDIIDYESEPIEDLASLLEEEEPETQQEQDLLQLAKKQMADDNMQQFLNQKRGGEIDTV